MVSFHTPTRTNIMMNPDFDNNSSKKRKWEESQAAAAAHDGDDHQPIIPAFNKPSKNKNTTKSFFNSDLHLETPLPLEWQRCLDIQSGQIYFYNTRTRMRTSKDPRITPSPPSPPGHMSLDLELNLTHGADNLINHGSDKKKTGGLTRSSSWLTFDQGDNQEMVTAVCKKCHMLVMMLKASPSCPNCKFMHPPDQTPRSFNPSLSLLC